jgi:hypothetical protein
MTADRGPDAGDYHLWTRAAPAVPEAGLADGLEAEDFAEPQMLVDARLGAALRRVLDETPEGAPITITMAHTRAIVRRVARDDTDATRALAALLRAPARDATGGGV